MIVFTNGCFDMLHVGHLNLLQYCRSFHPMGRVIVGLNSDESVRRLKGDRRPIIPEDDRAQMLRALRSVDWVHIFEEDTPLELIKRVRPNVIVKGPEWRGREREVVGSDLAEIVTYPYGRQDVTTSGIVGRIIERYR